MNERRLQNSVVAWLAVTVKMRVPFLFSHSCPVSVFMMKSAIYPKNDAIISFIPKILSASGKNDGFVIRMGTASSDVDKNTAKSVPTVIALREYRSDAMTLKPHCGIQPKTAPRNGPSFFVS